MNILLIEDDPRISEFICKGLQENNMVVQVANNGQVARELVGQQQWDVILLDIMLPDINGIELTKLIRFKNIFTPILILSALSDTSDKIMALDSGADDYITKPFHFSELLSRINALTRRSKFNQMTSEPLYSCAGISIDTQKHLVKQDQQVMDLSPREYKLLLFLMENKNKVVSRTQILQAVWSISFDTNTNVVDVYISYIRNKLSVKNKGLIQTIKGTGYMLSE
ncbi:response regulator transcription factor [Myroides sp. LJL110]